MTDKWLMDAMAQGIKRPTHAASVLDEIAAECARRSKAAQPDKRPAYSLAACAMGRIKTIFSDRSEEERRAILIEAAALIVEQVERMDRTKQGSAS